eukprot:CFRG8168T1
MVEEQASPVLLLGPPSSLTTTPLLLGILLADGTVHVIAQEGETLPLSRSVCVTTTIDNQISACLWFVVSGGRTQASACLLTHETPLRVMLNTSSSSFRSFTKINISLYLNEYAVVHVEAREEVGGEANPPVAERVFDLQSPTTIFVPTHTSKSELRLIPACDVVLYNASLVRRLPVKLPHRTIACGGNAYTIRQRFSGDVPVAEHDLTGCAVWESAIIAGHFFPSYLTNWYTSKELPIRNEHVIEMRGESKNKTLLQSTQRRVRVLELGCGAGLLSIVIASQCPFVDIVGTDGEALALKLSTENACSNGVRVVETFSSEDIAVLPAIQKQRSCPDVDIHTRRIVTTSKKVEDKISRRRSIDDIPCEGRIQFALLNWEDKERAAELLSTAGPFDFIVGTDLVYPSSPMQPLLTVLESLMTTETTAYIITKDRTGEGDAFIRRLQAESWVQNPTLHGPDDICGDFRNKHEYFRSVSFRCSK